MTIIVARAQRVSSVHCLTFSSLRFRFINQEPKLWRSDTQKWVDIQLLIYCRSRIGINVLPAIRAGVSRTIGEPDLTNYTDGTNNKGCEWLTLRLTIRRNSSSWSAVTHRATAPSTHYTSLGQNVTPRHKVHPLWPYLSNCFLSALDRPDHVQPPPRLPRLSASARIKGTRLPLATPHFFFWFFFFFIL